MYNLFRQYTWQMSKGSFLKSQVDSDECSTQGKMQDDPALGRIFVELDIFSQKRFKKGENMVQVNYVGVREKDFSTDIKKGT